MKTLRALPIPPEEKVLLCERIVNTFADEPDEDSVRIASIFAAEKAKIETKRDKRKRAK